MSIKFDQVHTEKKQALLDQMMDNVTSEIHELDKDLRNEKLPACPVCRDHRIVHFVEKYGFNIDKCEHCGLLFCNPYPTDNQIHYYYNSDMKQFENDFFVESFDNRVHIFLPRVEIIKKYKEKGSLLDVGSSIGIFVEALQQVDHDLSVTCCDISEDACNRLKKRFPEANIINSDFATLEGKNQYDVMTMWDTVEHIVDLNNLFSTVWRILADEGIFIFSTPNTMSFEWIVAGNNHVQLLPPGHVNLLNIDSIKILLKQHRFLLMETYTLNPSLDIDYVLKSTDKKSIDPSRVGVFLETMLRSEDFRLPFEELLRERKLAGSIVVVAKKVT